jgi:uncharacterized glyoxalase superfamily protein PhnB
MKKLTPVIIVDQIEPCLPFWVDRLGFEKTMDVPDGDALAFAILTKGNVEIMYQTRTSVAKDLGVSIGDVSQVASGPVDPGRDGVSFYMEVEQLDPIMKMLEGIEVVIPERTTFYGAREYGVREPGGNPVTFAEFTHNQ